jgi:hypothetical protein
VVVLELFEFPKTDENGLVIEFELVLEELELEGGFVVKIIGC